MPISAHDADDVAVAALIAHGTLLQLLVGTGVITRDQALASVRGAIQKASGLPTAAGVIEALKDIFPEA